MRPSVFCLLLLSAATAHAQAPPGDMAPEEAARVEAMRADMDPGSDFGPWPGEEHMTPEEAAQLQAAGQATQSYYARIATALAASGMPRDLAFAATLLQAGTQAPRAVAVAGDAPSQPVPRDPRIDEWRGLASQRAGSDVLANALLMQAGSPGEDPVRQAAVERWRRLEPDNLAPLLHAAGPADAWLPQAQAQQRFDLHYYDQARWMQSVLQAHPPSAEETAAMGGGDRDTAAAAAVAAMAMLAAVALPSLGPLAIACRDGSPASTPSRRPACRHVAQVMSEHSDTQLGARFGITLLGLTAEDPQQRADADARRRQMDWQMQQWGRIAGDPSDDGSAQFLRLLGDPAIRTEQDLAARALTEAGVSLDPPAGWQSPWH